MKRKRVAAGATVDCSTDGGKAMTLDDVSKPSTTPRSWLCNVLRRFERGKCTGMFPVLWDLVASYVEAPFPATNDRPRNTVYEHHIHDALAPVDDFFEAQPTWIEFMLKCGINDTVFEQKQQSKQRYPTHELTLARFPNATFVLGPNDSVQLVQGTVHGSPRIVGYVTSNVCGELQRLRISPRLVTWDTKDLCDYQIQTRFNAPVHAGALEHILRGGRIATLCSGCVASKVVDMCMLCGHLLRANETVDEKTDWFCRTAILEAWLFAKDDRLSGPDRNVAICGKCIAGNGLQWQRRKPPASPTSSTPASSPSEDADGKDSATSSDDDDVADNPDDFTIDDEAVRRVLGKYVWELGMLPRLGHCAVE